MRRQRSTTIIVAGGALAVASVGYGLGTQADGGTAVAESSQNGERGARVMIERGAPCGFSGLADELGVDESKLEQALRDFRGDHEGEVRVDFAQDLADALGISAGKVTEALDELHQRREQRFEQRFERRLAPGELPPPPGRMSFHFGMPLRELASELGVSRGDLRKALREVGRQAADRFERHNQALAEFLADRFDLDVDKVSDALGELGPPLRSGHRPGLPDHPPAP
jgi:transcriptional regulator with XRE-family HTH domain